MGNVQGEVRPLCQVNTVCWLCHQRRVLIPAHFSFSWRQERVLLLEGEMVVVGE